MTILDKAKLSHRFAIERRILPKAQALIEAATGKDVLDVGCVGQARSRHSPDWLHAQLSGVARELHGVDIDVAGVKELKDLGFTVFLPEELGNRTYDCVLMGDVIEHVDDPVNFLSSYGRRLRDDGRLVLTTPNAFSAAHMMGVLIKNTSVVNDEHVCWFDPMTLSEVVRRAGLELTDFHWVRVPPGRTSWKHHLVDRMSVIAQTIRPYVASDFLFVLRRST